MNQYFFNVSKSEKQNILDQHKKLYDGYVTLYNQENNLTPLYVQDYANDKGGITVSNTGNVKTYTNVGINEDINRKDKIGDGPDDLENGTVDLRGGEMSDDDSITLHDVYPSPNEDEKEIISLGITDDSLPEDLLGDLNDEDLADVTLATGAVEELPQNYEFDIDELEDFLSGPMNEVDEDLREDFKSQISESLDMFKRFKNYN
jgi:hypothetical protein